jgi:transcription termination/antitermination protein NusA
MAQARTEFAAALNQIASEKGVEPEVVLDAIRQAALAAYKKDLTLRNEPLPDDIDDYVAAVDEITGSISIKHGTEDVTPPGFARIAASIAKQVIMQRLYEAEKGAIMEEYEGKVGSVISGIIQRQEGNTYFIDLGRAEGILPPSEQIRDDVYVPHQRLKFYIKEIREGRSGPEVVLSRSDSELVKGLFALEVPEIQAGSVEIKVIAREAGGRTKVAAVSNQEGVDAVGSLVGQKGVRVQAVMQELGDEKIDIITYSDDPARFIEAALSPAKNIHVFLDKENQVAKVKIPESQLSLAIGKGGQNVRLAAKLTGWKIDIEGLPEEIAESETGILETETPEEGREKAEDQATNPEETPTEAVVEAVEENITEAEQEESVGGELQEAEDEPADPEVAAVAEEDIAESDEEEKKAA